jgi:hypothetical protein
VTTWRAEADDRLFDGHCPWCGKLAVAAPRMHEYRCSCGAVAHGALIYEFDKVLAPALASFDVQIALDDPRAEDPRTWRDAFGIEFREGGRVADIHYYYWFKRV